MNIPVLTELQSNLGDLKERIKLTDACTEPHRKRHCYTDEATSLSIVIEYIDRWINSTGCIVQPMWRNFFRLLEDTSPELGELAYQIKELFHGKLVEI